MLVKFNFNLIKQAVIKWMLNCVYKEETKKYDFLYRTH
jgi:hypothetical protein